MNKDDPGITEEILKMIRGKLEVFNRGKVAGKGRYYILLPNEKTLYYTLWFYNPLAVYHSFIYLSSLELNAIGSVAKAMRLTANSYLPLSIIREIDSYVENGDDLILFGRYRGHHLQEIYTIDPRYLLWLADKYEPRVKSEHRFKEMAANYAQAYLDLQTRRRYKTSSSQFVGEVGGRLTDFSLTVVRVRVTDDHYKTKIVGGVPHFYVDQLLTATDEAGNLFLLTMKAIDRSLVSGMLATGSHAYVYGEKLKIASAKILKHVELHTIKYTKLGYVKLNG